MQWVEAQLNYSLFVLYYNILYCINYNIILAILLAHYINFF